MSDTTTEVDRPEEDDEALNRRLNELEDQYASGGEDDEDDPDDEAGAGAGDNAEEEEEVEYDEVSGKSKKDEPTADDLGEYSLGEYSKAKKALEVAGFDPEDFESWSPRKICARGLKLSRQQAEQQTTWQRLQALEQTGKGNKESREEGSDARPQSQPDTSKVTLDGIRARLNEAIDEDTAGLLMEANEAVTAPLRGEIKRLTQALEVLTDIHFAREEKEALAELRSEFEDGRGKSPLDSADVRERVVARATKLRRADPAQSYKETLRDAARLELHDHAVTKNKGEGRREGQKEARKRRGASSMSGLRTQKGEARSFDEDLTEAILAAERRHNFSTR